jgi:hypothetical protein
MAVIVRVWGDETRNKSRPPWVLEQGSVWVLRNNRWWQQCWNLEQQYCNLKFEVFTAVNMSIAGFQVMTPCILVDGCLSFGGTYRLHRQGWSEACNPMSFQDEINYTGKWIEGAIKRRKEWIWTKEETKTCIQSVQLVTLGFYEATIHWIMEILNNIKHRN